MSIQQNFQRIEAQLASSQCRLITVTKTQPVEALLEAYAAGSKCFGENKVQEMATKYEQLPKDIEWHLIGHLQSNKVKFIASFVSLIHSVDSLKLLQEINRQALKNDRVIDCLLQMHIAQEETKFGLSETEAKSLLQSTELAELTNIRLVGLMGMATNTRDTEQIRQEFRALKQSYDELSSLTQRANIAFRELSMGMSGDYSIAIAEGSTLIRVGSAIFGDRK
ncbi:MAG: YggS family pyridoxal phosphate-dependent enzyme [Bacteroidota bacterium]